MPTERGEVGAAVVDGTIYVVGAYSGATDATEAYDPATDTWPPDLAPIPTPREHLAATVLDGRIHVIGGRSPALSMTGTTHEVYDPIANAWTTAAALPTGRSGIGAAV